MARGELLVAFNFLFNLTAGFVKEDFTFTAKIKQMLQTKVKASSMTNLTDARYFAAFEVEWLGFQLDPGSERYVQPQVAQAIREWVDGVKIVGEFGLQSAREIQTAADLLRLDAIQVGMFSEMETLADVNRRLPIIKEVVLESTTTAHELIEHLETFASSCAYFLLNFDKNGIAWKDLKNDLSAINFKSLQSICSVYPVLLSRDFNGSNGFTGAGWF